MADAGNSSLIRKASPQTKQGANFGAPNPIGSGKTANISAAKRSNAYKGK